MDPSSKITTKQMIVSGLALFAIFFGAGNLVLPPMMGLKAGASWPIALIGFLLSEIVFIFIGFQSAIFCNGDMREFGKKYSKNFGVLLGVVIMLLIGPIIAIPRTAATTFEMSVLPFFPDFNHILFSLIFFALTFFFSINGSSVVDFIGNYMTPALLFILIVILVKGIISPLAPSTQAVGQQLGAGFVEGYQTMDAITSVIMASTFITYFRDLGIKDTKEMSWTMTRVCGIACLLLGLVYGGLTYLGAISTSFGDPSMQRTELLTKIVGLTMGSFGNIALGLCTFLACLTTSVGLTHATSSFFQDFTKGKIPYKFMVIVTTLVACVISLLGVDQIIALSAPLLSVVYPVMILLTILNLLDHGRISHWIYKFSVSFTFIASIVDGIRAYGFKDLSLVKAFDHIPLAQYGFSWIFFSLVGIGLGFLVSRLKEKN
ncbi:branched-chain amino acid transport system II carrier protein [Kallipyga gabonensis]|uniref:branched-chain amino acid transport system II carrier protein n=1 Tax=Kallipyga gabonensis TaxID=1686287 RepID=UPI0006B547EB|nr:branched-chain amino acid transport system II carrier protein [Kallipyga gabonensis]